MISTVAVCWQEGPSTTFRQIAALFALALCACDGKAAVGPVTPDTLAARLNEARAGETLRLRPGNYGLVELPTRSFSPAIRIEAADAVFSGLAMEDGAGITIVGGRIVGPGTARGTGISLRKVARVTVEGMTIGGTLRGITVGQSEDVALVGNRLDGIQVDGIDIALSRRVLVKSNSCHNFKPKKAVFAADGTRISDGDHPDCIQAWSRPTAPPTADLTIVDNVIDGDMQGIFLGDGTRQGVPDGGFDRVVIRGNRVRVGYPNGIVANNLRDSVVAENVVETVPGATLTRRPGQAVKANMRIMGTAAFCGNKVASVPRAPGQQPCPKQQRP